MNTGHVLLLINQKSAVISIVASFIHCMMICQGFSITWFGIAVPYQTKRPRLISGLFFVYHFRLCNMQYPVKNMLDVAAGSTAIMSVTAWLPPIASLFTIIWLGIRIYESKTVQNLIKRK